MYILAQAANIKAPAVHWRISVRLLCYDAERASREWSNE